MFTEPFAHDMSERRCLRMVAAAAGAAALAVASLAPGVAPASAQQPAEPVVPTVVIEGRGWGHGVGMAQDGAYAMGVAGAGTEDILSQFYPGTELGSSSGPVRVGVLDGTVSTVLGFPDGGEVRTASGSSAPGFPVSVEPGGSVEISSDGGMFSARPLSGAALGPGLDGDQAPAEVAPTTAGDPPATTSSTVPNLLGIPLGPPPGPQPPDGPAPADVAPAEVAPPVAPPVEASSGGGLVSEPPDGSTITVGATGRRYRGTLESVGGAGGLRLVNEVDVEQYLRGMGEVRDPGWPSASLRAQAIAARTYALRAMRGGGEICDTDQCQVYLGQDVEYPAMDAAVAASRGQVVTYGGSLALSVYSANGGGFSATPEEAWGAGSGDHPYLRAAPYPSVPDLWTVGTSLPDLARRFGYPGGLAGASVSRAGPSGRPLEILLDGSGGAMAIAGHRFASELGLRSNFFTLKVEAVAVPPVAVAEGAVPGAGNATLTVGGVPAGLVRPTGGGMGRIPWIALALLLLVAVNLARRAMAGSPQLSGAGGGGGEAEAHAGSAAGRSFGRHRATRGHGDLADDGEPEP